jgi:hypothetical protein
VPALEFSFEDALNELKALDKLLAGFVRPESEPVIQQLISTLDGYRSSPSKGVVNWGIQEAFPLRTQLGSGLVQHNGTTVHAEITSTWDIEKIPAKKKSIPPSLFRLVGIASTRVRLMHTPSGASAPEQLGMWRMEVGDEQSPGCHFHVQILGEAADGQFPHSLDIPRLPSLVATPAAVVDFALGELYQDNWQHHVASQGAVLHRWVPIQRKWLGALLNWQLEIVSKCSGAPWPALKSSKPASDLFH